MADPQVQVLVPRIHPDAFGITYASALPDMGEALEGFERGHTSKGKLFPGEIRRASATPPSSRGSSGQAVPCVCQGKQESSSWFNNTGTCENMGSAPRIKPNKPTLAWRRACPDDRCHSTVATPGFMLELHFFFF